MVSGLMKGKEKGSDNAQTNLMQLHQVSSSQKYCVTVGNSISVAP